MHAWDNLVKKPRAKIMREFLLVFHLLVTLVLIGVILIQRGEDAGAGGGSGGLPGARSGKNPLTRVTAILAAIFFADCLGMAILIRKDSQIGTEPIGKSESAPKPSGTLPAVAAKPVPVVVNGQKNQQKPVSEQQSSVNPSGQASGAKSAPVSSRSPAEASKPVVMTDSKKKPLKSSSKSSAKAKKKSKDRVKKSA
jgi:preprotein translocase subunit SecG